MMKLIPLLMLSIGLNSYAEGVASQSVLLSEREVELNVDISTAKMKLSRAGYTSPTVKVLVPDLADVTILNHRNEGEGAPCLATFQTLFPEDVIQNNPRIEKIKFNIRLTKSTRVVAFPHEQDDPEPYCEVNLNEYVSGMIRGFEFVHSVTKQVDKRKISDCR